MNEIKDEMATEKTPGSEAVKHVEATVVDVVACMLPIYENGNETTMTSADAAHATTTTEKEVAKYTKVTDPPIADNRKEYVYVQLVVASPSELNEMSSSPPRKI